MLKNDQWFLVRELLVVGFLLLGIWFGFFSGKGKPENRGGNGPVILILYKFPLIVFSIVN